MIKMPMKELQALLKEETHTFEWCHRRREIAWYAQNDYKGRALYGHARLSYLSFRFESLLGPKNLKEQLIISWGYVVASGERFKGEGIFIGRRISVLRPEPHVLKFKQENGPISFEPKRGGKFTPAEEKQLLRLLNRAKKLYYQEVDEAISRLD